MTLLCCTIISGGLLKVCWRCLLAASAGSIPYLLSRCGRSWRCQEVGLPSFFEEYDQSVWKERCKVQFHLLVQFHVFSLLIFASPVAVELSFALSTRPTPEQSLPLSGFQQCTAGSSSQPHTAKFPGSLWLLLEGLCAQSRTAASKRGIHPNTCVVHQAFYCGDSTNALQFGDPNDRWLRSPTCNLEAKVPRRQTWNLGRRRNRHPSTFLKRSSLGRTSWDCGNPAYKSMVCIR